MYFKGFWCSPVRRNPAAKRVWCGSTKFHTMFSGQQVLGVAAAHVTGEHCTQPCSCFPPRASGTGRLEVPAPAHLSLLPSLSPSLPCFPFLTSSFPLLPLPPSLPISPLSCTALSSSAVPLSAAPGGRRQLVNDSCDLEIPGGSDLPSWELPGTCSPG